MHISWLGQTCVKLQTKNADEDVVIMIDAYRPEIGEFPRSFSSQIALYSHGEDGAVTVSQDPFVLSTLGECEIKNCLVYSYPFDDKVIFKIVAEGIIIVHLGQITKKLDNALLEKIGDPDILFVPVGGGKSYLSSEDAASVVTTIEPRIVIPMGFQCDTEPKAMTVNDFIKEIGLKPDVTDKKIIIKKKDLPAEETKLMILEKNY